MEISVAAAGKKLRSVRGKVAVMPIVGVVEQRSSLFQYYFGGASTEAIGAALDEMMGRSDVAAIVLDVDSPGGSIDGVQELSDKIFQARKTKPIYAISNSSMYSAAYWIASSATSTFATTGGGVGSVGVYIMHWEESEGLADRGIKVNMIRKPEHKAEANAVERLTAAGREHLQSVVDSSYVAFTAAVARNRGVDAATVRNDYGGGRIVLAKDAKAAGMIDGIKTMDSLLLELAGGEPARSSARANVDILRKRAEHRARVDLKRQNG